MTSHFIYASLWVIFGIVHSALATPQAKQNLATYLGKAYRLTYNIVAIISFAAILYAGKVLLAGEPFPRHTVLIYAQYAMTIVGFIMLLAAARSYDRNRFLGLAQLQDHTANIDPDNGEALTVSGLNAHIRHPAYSASMLLLWGLATNEFMATTAAYATAYFIIGAHYEEKKLITRFGKAYEDYKAKTPAFIPKLKS